MRRVPTLLATACLVLVLAAGGAKAGEITLAAAASLKEAVNDISARFAGSHPGVIIRKNFGSSGALAKQIENGAPAGIYISADRKWVSYLAAKELLDPGLPVTLAYNTLVFVGNGQTPTATLPEVVRLERIAIGSPKSVPAGDYAMQALHQAGIDQALEKKLVMAKDVRECLMYAERGEVDGAFVYRSDALLAKKTHILFTVPAGLHAPITYPMALTRTGAENGEVRGLWHYLQTAEAKEVLRRYGFALP